MIHKSIIKIHLPEQPKLADILTNTKTRTARLTSSKFFLTNVKRFYGQFMLGFYTRHFFITHINLLTIYLLYTLISYSFDGQTNWQSYWRVTGLLKAETHPYNSCKFFLQCKHEWTKIWFNSVTVLHHSCSHIMEIF